MPNKILSQSGMSMADTYDIKGSVIGVEELAADTVHVSENFGDRVFSERLTAFIVLQSSTAVNQNAAWNVPFGGPSDSVNRVFAIQCIADVAARVATAALFIRNTSTGREIPIWFWDENENTSNIRWSQDGGGVTTEQILVPGVGMFTLPSLIMRQGVNQEVPQFMFRGSATGFGAGTVTVQCLIYMARPNLPSPTAGSPSSHGLPLPSW